jgi:class 3 adenylate cyclase/pimeloyl-ACP methyl ester carboxylesterase
MEPPVVQYARLDGVSLAFQSAGAGVDVLLMAGSSGTSVTWRDDVASGFFVALARFSHLVTFEQRGAGLSDPIASGQPLTLEARVHDALTVLDAAELDRPFVVATHDGGPVALLAVTTQPERFRGLVLINTSPRLRQAPDYPDGLDDTAAAWFVEQMRDRWGTGWSVNLFAASFADLPDGRARWALLEQSACSPGQAVLQTEQALATDARHLLELVGIPTLVVQRRDDPAVAHGNGRYLADRIPGCWLVELPGSDHMPWSSEGGDVVGAIRLFMGQDAEPVHEPRRLAAVVFTDIVASTEALSRLGDSRWAALLDVHDAVAGRLAGALGGRVVKCTGDGTLSVFLAPGQAIRYALALRDEVRHLGVQLRAGVHAGEIVTRGDDVSGIAVHAAARVSALAPDGAVYVSRTVTDLVAGSGLTFTSTGHHALKGLAETWEIFAVEPLGNGVAAGLPTWLSSPDRC